MCSSNSVLKRLPNLSVAPNASPHKAGRSDFPRFAPGENAENAEKIRKTIISHSTRNIGVRGSLPHKTLENKENSENADCENTENAENADDWPYDDWPYDDWP